MNKDQVRFLASGLFFGFLLGYIVAFGVHDEGVVQRAAPVPAAGNIGMSPAVGVGAAPVGQGSEDEMMNRVFEEMAALKHAIEKDPKNHPMLVRLANLYHDAGMYDQAIGYYDQALAIEPADVNARTDMAICMRRLGKSDDAIAQFRTSLSYQPRHWQTWLNLGIVSLFDKNDVQTATEAFTKLEELNPTYKELPLLKEAVTKARGAAAKTSS
jgi:tetratricopeptide (TPR) repeat protein